MNNQEHTRQEIETMKTMDRPKVRVKYDCVLIDEDGKREEARRETTGRIIVDDNNPWIEIHAGGKQIAERFSWSLVLEILNDRFAAPVYFSTRVEYEV